MFVTILSQAGGQSKTTTALNLAAAWGLAGRAGTVVDLDNQQNDSLKFAGFSSRVCLASELPTHESGFVVVDTPPSLVAIVGPALLRSELVIVPCTPTIKGLESLNTTFDTIENARAKNPNLRALVLLTQCDTTRYTQGIHAAASALCAWPVASITIPLRRSDFETAALAKIPVVCHKPKSPAARAYAEFAASILPSS